MSKKPNQWILNTTLRHRRATRIAFEVLRERRQIEISKLATMLNKVIHPDEIEAIVGRLVDGNVAETDGKGMLFWRDSEWT